MECIWRIIRTNNYGFIQKVIKQWYWLQLPARRGAGKKGSQQRCSLFWLSIVNSTFFIFHLYKRSVSKSCHPDTEERSGTVEGPAGILQNTGRMNLIQHPTLNTQHLFVSRLTSGCNSWFRKWGENRVSCSFFSSIYAEKPRVNKDPNLQVSSSKTNSKQ